MLEMFSFQNSFICTPHSFAAIFFPWSAHIYGSLRGMYITCLFYRRNVGWSQELPSSNEDLANLAYFLHVLPRYMISSTTQVYTLLYTLCQIYSNHLLGMVCSIFYKTVITSDLHARRSFNLFLQHCTYSAATPTY